MSRESCRLFLIIVVMLLCLITFGFHLLAAGADGIIDAKDCHQLMSAFDGFESAILFLVALLFKDKK